MKIELEQNALVVLIGAMGTGKSTFCETHFAPHHVVSSDFIREQLSGDFEDQSVNKPTFEILHETIRARAKHGIFTVVDSTGSQSVVDLARQLHKEYEVPVYFLCFPELDDEDLTPDRMQHRMGYIHAYHRQVARIKKMRFSDKDNVTILPKNGDGVRVTIQSGNQYQLEDIGDKRIAIIPDLHGEIKVLLDILERYPEEVYYYVFLGDLVDRGESSYQTFSVVWSLVNEGKASCVKSNHDDKLSRYFKKWLADEDPEKYFEPSEFDEVPNYGMKIAHGLDGTLREFYSLDTPIMNNYARRFIEFYESCPTYLYHDDGHRRHMFAHAGVTEAMVRGHVPNAADRSTALYKTMVSTSDLINVVPAGSKVTVHLGHHWVSDRPQVVEGLDDSRMIKHDVGIGKRHLIEVMGLEVVVL